MSLPFALRRGGIVVGALLLVLTAVGTDFSVFTLVSCSRRSGASTYENVAHAAFGRWGGMFTMGLVRSAVSGRLRSNCSDLIPLLFLCLSGAISI